MLVKTRQFTLSLKKCGGLDYCNVYYCTLNTKGLRHVSMNPYIWTLHNLVCNTLYYDKVVNKTFGAAYSVPLHW